MRYAFHRRLEHDEASALETDVVRFVAVVGLTLMVVFALVHALPYRSEIEEVAPALQADDTRTVELELTGALQRATKLSAELEQERTRSARLAEQIELEGARTSTLTRRLEAEHARSQRSLAETQRELASTRRDLARTRDALASAQVRVTTAPSPPPEIAAKQPLPPAPVDAVEEVETPETADPAGGSGEASFAIRFRDDEVYLDLLRRERIRSYLRVPALDLTYEISGDAGRGLGFVLVYGSGAQRMYRIPEGMVPGVLLEATGRFDSRLAARGDLEFLVVLSDRIRERLGPLEAGGGGTWDILADERVVAAGTVLP